MGHDGSKQNLKGRVMSCCFTLISMTGGAQYSGNYTITENIGLVRLVISITHIVQRNKNKKVCLRLEIWAHDISTLHAFYISWCTNCVPRGKQAALNVINSIVPVSIHAVNQGDWAFSVPAGSTNKHMCDRVIHLSHTIEFNRGWKLANDEACRSEGPHWDNSSMRNYAVESFAIIVYLEMLNKGLKTESLMACRP